ncbi:MAG: electron transport complex subunit RsxC [Idiomarina sp.]|nr:electron transport complex subunit RsxC [Idiomarina sp.]
MAIEITATSRLWNFPGGVQPDERKSPANLQPIQRFPLAPMLYIPLRQHAGAAGELCVAVGDYVLKGQPLTIPGVDNGLPVHASTSGTIKAITEHPLNHPSGLSGLTVHLQPDDQDAPYPHQPIADIHAISQREVLQHLQQMGIAGLGGAGFPTARKVAGARNIDALIINGIECEPYIVADDRLMREHAAKILRGCELLQQLTSAKSVIFAIEDNKPEAINAVATAIAETSSTTIANIILRVIPTKYPSGGEKQLIQILTGKQVPANGLPADIGILMQNVATAYAVAHAIDVGEPLLERVVTLTGEALHHPGTAWAPLGTPVEYLLQQSGFQPSKHQRVIIGGPMMGYTIANLQVPVTKTTNCILAPTASELTPADAEMACIRCGACEQACPASLLPQQLYWHAKAQDYDALKQHHIVDCIECGICAYVCPSQIPLVQYYRQAKAEIREQAIEHQKAEIARQRFEARQLRLEREKEERLEKHRRAAEARKAAQAARAAEAPTSPSAADTKPSAGKGTNAAVQAALARAKAKKAAQEQPDSSASIGPSAAVQAAIERAKAKKAAQAAAPEQAEPVADKGPSAAVQAAIERAKAKKAAQANAESSQSAEPAPENNTQSDKQDAIAAAVARAKARKAEREQAKGNTESQNNAAENERKGKQN